jgi:hypothetical protein
LLPPRELAGEFKIGAAVHAVLSDRMLSEALERQTRHKLNNFAHIAPVGGRDISKVAVRIRQLFTSADPATHAFKLGDTWSQISITPYPDFSNVFIKEPRCASNSTSNREALVKKSYLEVDMIRIDDHGDSNESQPLE